MRALAVYNTRGMVAPLEILRKRHLEHCDLFIHCGNSMVDYKNEFILGYVTMQGVNDFEQHFLRDYIIEIDTKRILIINNIDFRAQDGFEKLVNFTENLYDKMDIVICAFDPQGTTKKINDIIYISPGDANEKTSNTYAIVETNDDSVNINFFDILSGDLVASNTYDY